MDNEREAGGGEAAAGRESCHSTLHQLPQINYLLKNNLSQLHVLLCSTYLGKTILITRVAGVPQSWPPVQQGLTEVCCVRSPPSAGSGSARERGGPAAGRPSVKLLLGCAGRPHCGTPAALTTATMHTDRKLGPNKIFG